MDTVEVHQEQNSQPEVKELVRIIQDHRPQFEAGQYEDGELMVLPFWFCNNCTWQMDITEPDDEQDKHLARAILDAGFRKNVQISG